MTAVSLDTATADGFHLRHSLSWDDADTNGTRVVSQPSANPALWAEYSLGVFTRRSAQLSQGWCRVRPRRRGVAQRSRYHHVSRRDQSSRTDGGGCAGQGTAALGRPLGAGPRRCLGDHFAMQEATVALAGILRHVEIRPLRKDFPTTAPLTVISAAPVRALVRRRAHGA